MFKSKQIITTGVTHNCLAAGTVVKGNIKAEEDFRIDGVLEGNIECVGKLVIGPSAEIIGSIHCSNAELMGKIKGNIKAQGTLCLKSSVIYQGDIIANNLEIEPGATFNGTCTMTEVTSGELYPQA
ncbi:MAG: polymer-forming cytoskeletal protein [Dysgonamonadaceae bacterium]|jgi:cytoskeletal protein CcmA (bactofilin family)|nr:polymer-forming cytoskeletal protein [Dysgonamonadaceae bacterium]